MRDAPGWKAPIAEQPAVEEPPTSQAEQLIEGAIRMAEADIKRTQGTLIEKIEAEKTAHTNVEFWKTELNTLVAKRQELEASLRRLRV